MEIHLTEEELRRERNLFAPRQKKYALLAGKAFDVRSFAEQIKEDIEGDDMALPPSSC